MKTQKKVARKLAQVAVAASIAAAAYYLYGSKNAKKHQKNVGAWTLKARQEIAREIKKLKTGGFNQESYRKVVQIIADRYRNLQGLTKKEALEFIKTLASEWKEIESEAMRSGQKTKVKSKKIIQLRGD